MARFAGVAAVAFDFDDTLVDLSGARRAGLRAVLDEVQASGHPLDAEAFQRRFHERSRAEDAHYLAVGEYPPVQLRFEALCREFGLPSDGFAVRMRDTYSAARFAALRPFPETEDALRAIEGRRPLFMITNGPGAGQHRGIEVSGLAHYFQKVFVCDDFGLRKPLAQMFELLRSAAGITPAQMLIVGDNAAADTDVPRTLGWQTAWVVRDDRQRAAADPKRADAVVRSVEEIPRLLGL